MLYIREFRFSFSLANLFLIHPSRLWLLFCLTITMFWTIMLAYSGPSQAHEYLLSRTNTRSSSTSRSYPSSRMGTFNSARLSRRTRLIKASRQFFNAWKPMVSSLDRSKALIILNYIAAFALWLLFVIGPYARGSHSPTPC
jgi:hypothetical protein